jgi:hypothetical protein
MNKSGPPKRAAFFDYFLSPLPPLCCPDSVSAGRVSDLDSDLADRVFDLDFEAVRPISSRRAPFASGICRELPNCGRCSSHCSYPS